MKNDRGRGGRAELSLEPLGTRGNPPLDDRGRCGRRNVEHAMRARYLSLPSLHCGRCYLGGGQSFDSHADTEDVAHCFSVSYFMEMGVLDRAAMNASFRLRQNTVNSMRVRLDCVAHVRVVDGSIDFA